MSDYMSRGWLLDTFLSLFLLRSWLSMPVVALEDLVPWETLVQDQTVRVFATGWVCPRAVGFFTGYTFPY